MPCSVPCNRLPCDERCSKELTCGHQCPSICGESCPENYCHVCSDKKDVRVDMIEMKTYREIDVNKTPIVVLACGHFFTAETLDGIMKMSEVYTTDQDGKFTGLKDISGPFSGNVPSCPDCKCPIRQYVTQRYNRALNRAVINEMSKRFLMKAQKGLGELKERTKFLENDLNDSRSTVMSTLTSNAKVVGGKLTLTSPASTQWNHRYDAYTKLENDIKEFIRNVSYEHQPARKLHDAIVHASRKQQSEHMMSSPDLHTSIPPTQRDQRISTGAEILTLKLKTMFFEEKFEILTAMYSKVSLPPVLGSIPRSRAVEFFKHCESVFESSKRANLARFAVEATLYYAKYARVFERRCQKMKTDIDKAEEYVKKGEAMLAEARELCNQPFQNADTIRDAVDGMIKVLRKQWYEDVTDQEIDAIKKAMVQGPGGMATHSGHWYNCVNGHPVS